MSQQPVEVGLIGAGMIVHDLLLPALYQLQRAGVIGRLTVCDARPASVQVLREDPAIKAAFPESTFRSLPEPGAAGPEVQPELFRQLLATLPPRSAVVVAVPDQFHYRLVKAALEAGHHVVCVKPLVLEYRQGVELEGLSKDRGLFVGIEYHKRFDRRSLMARRRCQEGAFGEFVLGEARLMEPYYYRHSNFQNWFTCDKTDPFVYVGCHYVDLVAFITGLRPSEVAVAGVRGHFPNGNEAFLWSLGRVRFENGALLSVANGLGYPDDAAGSNDQGLSMFFEGRNGRTGMLRHQDQFRGVEHSFADQVEKRFQYVNPDFFQYVPWEGAGLKPIGYGPDSVSALVTAIRDLEAATAGVDAATALRQRRELLAQTDARGILATPANSSYNELVQEAARHSILEDGATYRICYGADAHVERR